VRNEEECVCCVCLFRCNIFIDVRIIKEMPGSVASGTPVFTNQVLQTWRRRETLRLYPTNLKHAKSSLINKLS